MLNRADIAAVVCDLDGTVYLGDHVIPGVPAAIARLRASGRRVLFLSNNPTKTPDQYVSKLTKLGIPATSADVLTSALIMAEWLAAQPGAPRVYAIGEPALISTLQSHGVQLSDVPGQIDYVLASFDRTFAYPKLQIAFDAVRAGAKLIATNPDKYCPVPGGGEPDAAAIIAAIEACADTTLQFTAGKPSPLAAHAVATRLGLPIASCLMVGDRLETDIGMAATGMPTALVLTGASTQALADQWAGPAPSLITASVVTLVDFLLT